MDDTATAVASGARFEIEYWTGAGGVQLVTYNHEYNGNSHIGHGGHCFPHPGDGVCDAGWVFIVPTTLLIDGQWNHRCCQGTNVPNGDSWAELAIRFFKSHPCDAAGAPEAFSSSWAPTPTPELPGWSLPDAAIGGDDSKCRDVANDCCANAPPTGSEVAVCADGYTPSVQPSSYDDCPNYTCYPPGTAASD
jgi:hypothetical protein